MNVEIVEFYPLQNGKGIISGTLRIKLCDLGIHILGIYVTKKGDHWFFNLPGRNGIYHETGKTIRYPFVVFENSERHALFMNELRKKGRVFVEEWLIKKQILEETSPSLEKERILAKRP